MEAATRSRDMLDGWPQKGYDGPQPWEHDKLGISPEARAEVGTGRNTVTPVVSHSYPILTSGSAHPCVHELGRKLGELGFPNSVSQGENPFGSVDQSVLSAVGSFRAQYGVEPDPSGFGGATPQGRALAASHLDPWTVEAIIRAHANEFDS
jgi:hypothetical protein